jgi:hypothetical protein
MFQPFGASHWYWPCVLGFRHSAFGRDAGCVVHVTIAPPAGRSVCVSAESENNYEIRLRAC